MLPFDLALERDPNNTLYCHRDIETYTNKALDFSIYDRHEYIHTESSGL